MNNEDELIYSYEELEDLVIKYQNISNNLQQENKQLKETIKEATRILNSAKNHYGTDGKNWALERTIRLLGDKENECKRNV